MKEVPFTINNKNVKIKVFNIQKVDAEIQFLEKVSSYMKKNTGVGFDELYSMDGNTGLDELPENYNPL